MNIKLTEKQLQIIQGILTAKNTIVEEYNRIVTRETDFIVTVCESHNVTAVTGINLDGDTLVIPDTPIDMGTKETKQKKK